MYYNPKYPNKLFRDGYLYQFTHDIDFDVISGNYKLTIKKICREFYSRRKDLLQHSFGYSYFHIFISKNAPLFKSEGYTDTSNHQPMFKIIENNWRLILIYALDNISPDIINGVESPKYHESYCGTPKDISHLLGIDESEYLNMTEFSPYS